MFRSITGVCSNITFAKKTDNTSYKFKKRFDEERKPEICGKAIFPEFSLENITHFIL